MKSTDAHTERETHTEGERPKVIFRHTFWLQQALNLDGRRGRREEQEETVAIDLKTCFLSSQKFAETLKGQKTLGPWANIQLQVPRRISSEQGRNYGLWIC